MLYTYIVFVSICVHVCVRKYDTNLDRYTTYVYVRESVHLFTKEPFQQKWSQNTLWENEHRTYTDIHKKGQK